MPSPCDLIDMIVSKSVAAVEAMAGVNWVFRETEGKFDLQKKCLNVTELRDLSFATFSIAIACNRYKIWGQREP
jgi:hypothetical protein